MKNKNALIGGLLAVVLIMAVGYAVFSTNLTINSSASVTSTWKVLFDNTATSGTATGSASCGTITYSNSDMTATISNTTLTKPGDKCTYSLTIKNTGTLDATLAAPTLTGTSCTVSGLTCTSTSGHIKYTVTSPAGSLANTSGTKTMTVTAEFPDATVSSATVETSSLAITINATQA